ncbi:DNA recombination protein RmuC [Halioxenophilus sp. WMMB6]|uniref:DNA recombination protein RmuC n=1 Tax=Halioxenophilus sp. WMMB6 TaxID=3073815 RepID=UPI00295F49CC|nr:DNA recombination protein RmuC [Halioxenophilus sp. WMMB6]
MVLTQQHLITIAAALLAVALLAILIWSLTRHFYRSQLAQLQQQLAGEMAQLVSMRQESQAQQQVLQQQQREHNELQRRYSVLEAQADNLTTTLGELKQSEQLLRSQLQASENVRQETLANHKAAQVTIAALQAKTEELQQAIGQWQGKWEALNKENARLLEENVQLNSSVVERERGLKEQMALFEKQKQDLTDRFQVLANEILEKKSQALAESNKQGLNSVINPFQQSIDAFKKEVQEIHHRESTQRGELKKELEQLKALNQQITTEAHELSTALKGQKKLQGNWGELVLENVLDRSGLQAGKDYQREASFTTEAGRQRPDAVVFLPQNKHLIIDAKVSLNAYTRFVNAEDEQERTLALAEHVQAMASRIKELADRDYYKIPGLNSPEVVFMFVPIESAFVEALKADENLFQSAIERNVLVATPTTLLTSLNIVRQLWRFEDQNKHTAALAEKAEGVFNKLNTFLGSFADVKKGLDKATEAYGKAENQLVSGRGNLVKRVGEFKNLAPAIKTELHAHFAERAELEVDFLESNDDEAPLNDEVPADIKGLPDSGEQAEAEALSTSELDK